MVMPSLCAVSCLDWGQASAEDAPPPPPPGQQRSATHAHAPPRGLKGLPPAQRQELLASVGVFPQQSVLGLEGVFASSEAEGRRVAGCFPALAALAVRAPQDGSFLQLLQGMLAQRAGPAGQLDAQAEPAQALLQTLCVDCLPRVK